MQRGGPSHRLRVLLRFQSLGLSPICITPGYDAVTELYYHPSPGFIVPEIPSQPTSDQMARAVAVIDDIPADFPFVDAASRANAWATLIAALIRAALTGRVPAGLFDAPKSGSGKSLLASIIATVATGRPAAMFSAPKDDEEMRKQVTSSLMAGATVIIIDNMEARVDYPSLARALTAPVWADRVLGSNDMVYLPVQATRMLTGNNLVLGGDMPRRTYLVRIDPKVAHPWERPTDSFRHHDITTYVSDHRGEIVAAILTVVRGWFAVGKPAPTRVPTFGGYESWATTIGGILEFAKVDHFLGNLGVLHGFMDEDTPAWTAFFSVWYEVLGDSSITVKDLVRVLKTSEEFRDAIPDFLTSDFTELMAGHKSNFDRRVGKALQARKDSIYPNDLALRRAGEDTHTKVACWSVQAVTSAGSGGEWLLPTGKKKRKPAIQILIHLLGLWTPRNSPNQIRFCAICGLSVTLGYPMADGRVRHNGCEEETQ